MNRRILKSKSRLLLIASITFLFFSILASDCCGMQEKKVAISIVALPTEILKAIEKAIPKGRILKIEKEVEGEHPGQYDLEISSEGKVYEVEVSPQGQVIEVKEQNSTQEIAIEKNVEQVEQPEKKWTDSFDLENCKFSTQGRNRFFILEPGYQLVLASSTEKVTITVLNETMKIGNIETRILEEREEEEGELKEVSRNFFAICKEHGDVFYFGEEVDDYNDGKIIAHSGAWRADANDSKAGIMMPGTPLLGARHYQEIAPNAMDRAEIISDDVTLKTPAGTFTNCIRVEETSGLDPEDKCYKTYAPVVGLIQDEDLLLIEYTKIEDIEFIEKDDKAVDQVDIVKEDQEVELQTESDEKVLSKKVEKDEKDNDDEPNGKAASKEDEDDEEIVSIDDVPKRIKNRILKLVKNGQIEEIERTRKNGKVTYQVEIISGGKEIELRIGHKGKLLSKKIEYANDDED